MSWGRVKTPILQLAFLEWNKNIVFWFVHMHINEKIDRYNGRVIKNAVFLLQPDKSKFSHSRFECFPMKDPPDDIDTHDARNSPSQQVINKTVRWDRRRRPFAVISFSRHIDIVFHSFTTHNFRSGY